MSEADMMRGMFTDELIPPPSPQMLYYSISIVVLWFILLLKGYQNYKWAMKELTMKANAKKKDIDFAKKLPIGFVSSRKSSNFDGTYCLIKIKGQLFQAMKNRNTNKIEISPGDSSSEKMLSYIRVMPDEELGEQSEDHYDSVKEIVDYISEIQSVDAFEDVSVIFSSCVSKN